MAVKKLSFIEVLSSIQEKVEVKTGLRCYDDIPKNAKLPFYFVEIIGQEPNPSKMMFKEIYDINIHVFAEGGSSVKLFNAIKDLEESLTEEINIPEPYRLMGQNPKGVQRIFTDSDGSKHAIMGYGFEIFYGYKIK